MKLIFVHILEVTRGRIQSNYILSSIFSLPAIFVLDFIRLHEKSLKLIV